jgi:hypothetical protein
MTTSYLDWATVDDTTNVCMADLYHKMGVMGFEQQRADTLHVDILPRRIDRKDILRSVGLPTSVPLLAEPIVPMLPDDIRNHWLKAHTDALRRSTARVVLNFGKFAASKYREFAQEEGHDLEAVCIGAPSSQRYPWAWLQNRLDRASGHCKMVRFIIDTAHPECFHCKRRSACYTRPRHLTVQGRLVELAAV